MAVATDGSEGADAALAWAVSFARDRSSELLAIRVLPEGDGEDPDGELRELEESLPAEELECRGLVTAGEDVAATIVAEVESAEADVLVIGSSGMRGRKQFLLGNVANRVTHLASCTVIVVNTSADAPTQEVVEPSVRGRAGEIARELGGLGARRLSARAPWSNDDDPDGPRELREALERLGPTFGKIGQILSTRPDLLPEAYVSELASLQADVPPLQESEVVAAMESELGVPWEDVFESIEPEPLAAGTIGQVHRARLVGGDRVVVKVRRPGAGTLIERDLELLGRVVGPLSRLRRIRRIIDLPGAVDQVASSLRDELDFTTEARNLTRMGASLSSFAHVAVPAPHEELSSEGLLVVDEVVGAIPLAEAPPGEARTVAVRELLHAFYKQVLGDGFFHADPHPGNLLWADEAIWLIDLGMVGRLDDPARRQLMLLMLAVAQGDVEMLADISLELAGGAAEVDLAGYRSDLEAVVDQVRGRSLRDIQVVDLLNQLTAISLRHGVRLPTSLAMVGKTLAQVELTVSELAPELDPMEEAGRFFVRNVGTQLVSRLDPPKLFYEIERMRYRVSQIGESLAIAAGSRPGRRFEVRFTSERLERRIARAGRIAGLGFGAGGAWLAAGRAATGERADPRFARTLGGLAAAATAGLIAEVLRDR